MPLFAARERGITVLAATSATPCTATPPSTAEPSIRPVCCAVTDTLATIDKIPMVVAEEPCVRSSHGAPWTRASTSSRRGIELAAPALVTASAPAAAPKRNAAAIGSPAIKPAIK